MIRRARLSFKPNVRPGARSVGSGARDGGAQPEEPVQAGEATAGPEEKSIGGESQAQRSPDIPEKAAATSSENEPSKPAAAPLQRRKRISTLPNIAKPRVSTSTPVTPSQKPQQVESPPSLPVSSVPSKDEVSPPEKAKVPNSPQGSNSAPQGQHVTLPEKRTPIPQVPQFSPFKKATLKHPELGPVKSVDFTQKEEFSPLKERPSQKSSPNECKKSTPKMLVATGNLEKVRLRRAQKLRELLKDELKKERKEWKAKHPVISNIGELERSKMVMRDFIYFIPDSNPMKSSFAETRSSEKAPTESQLSGTPVKNISNDEDDDMDEEEEDDSQLLAPRVKVAEDGSIILDEESLTVEVSRGKAPIVEGNDPIFERGSTTTYSSFRKSTYSKPWSEEETDMFYLAISMVGTDFSMIGQLFPHRQRIEIKNKFKREERANSWRIDKAFRNFKFNKQELGIRNPYEDDQGCSVQKTLHRAEEKKAFDLVFFSKRLERALEAAKKRRTAPKVRQPREKKPAKPRKKPKDKATAEHVLSDEEMAMLSDGEGADTRTEEKENEGSVSIKDSLLQSDNVPGKKRRNRKKKDTKEPEEEPHESSPEDTTTLPKKPRKKRAADQVKGSELAVNDKNLEDVQEAPNTAREKKKKKSRKKKSTDKEVEPEDTEDGNIDVSSLQKDAVVEKSTGSAFPDDADSLMCIESGEPSFTQSEVLTCAEESSLILFTEESECFSEPDDISSLQESLSVIPGSQTLADQTGSFENVLMETSQEDSVFETSCHLTSDSPKEAPLDEDMDKDSHTGTEAEGSTESQKELSRPPALARSRFQGPRPNLPVRALPRQEKVLISEREDITEERNDLPADNSSSPSHQKDKSITENLESEESEFSITSSPTKEDIACPVQTNSSLESPQLQPGDSDIVPPKCAAEMEDIKKEKPLPIRGRLVRPKPNLKKAPVKDKPHSPDLLRSPPKSDSQDSEEIAMVPCTVVLTPLSNNEKDTLTKAESSTSSQEQSAKSTIKPAPLVRGYLQRPKPNTTKTSRKEKYEDVEGSEKCDKVSSEDVTASKASCSPSDAVPENREEQEDMSTHKDTCLDFATVQESCIPMKEAFSTSLSPVQEITPDPDPALSSVSESKAKSKTSPIKLPQGQLQTLKPNVLKSCDHKGISGMRLEDDTDITFEDTGQDVKVKIGDLSDLGKPTDFGKEASTSDESCGHQENRMKPTEMDPVLPINPKPEVGPKVSEEVQQPAKATVLTRGRLQRPKPNIVRAVPRRGVLTSSDDSRNKSEVEDVRKAPESSQPATSYESEKAPILANAATEDTPSPVEIAHSHVLSLETIGLPSADQIEHEESPSVSVDDSAPVGMKKEFSGSEDEKKAAPTKATLTRSRLVRPKPNLGSSVTRTSVSAPQKCDVREEGKSGKDDVNTSSVQSLSHSDAEKKLVLANNETEDAASPEEITQSYILPLETIVLPGVDQMDSEESSAVPMDNSSTVTIKNNVSTSEDERMIEPSPGLTRSRLQRPKPNLGRSVTRPALFTPQKCDVHEERKTTSDSFDSSSMEKTQKQNVDLSQESCPAESYDLQLGTEVQGGSVEGSVQIEQSSCTGEQVKEPSVKPLRNRFQKPKPNLGRASVRKESGAFASEQKEASFDSTSKRPEPLANKEGSSLVFTNDAASGNRAESTQHTTIKPALLRRSRLARPVPSYGKPSNKSQSALQSKTVDEEETSTDTDLEASSNKRKASECFPDVSPKRSCIPDTSQNSSDSALDQVPSTSALPDSSQSNDMLEDNKQQHSRFGRLLKKSVSTTPPVVTIPSENVTERPEKKTSRNLKSVKSTVAKPTSSKGKTTLVKIRAMKEEEDEDDDDELEYEDEDYDVAPDKLNQAPVFVPFSLRSPKPIPAEIEETVEEFEIPVEDLGVPISTAQNLRSPCLTLRDVSQHVPVSQADPGNKGHCDGSTEAAMTLISIGNSVFQSKLGEPLDSDQNTGSQLSLHADCKPEASTLSVQMACATESDTTINARSVKICQDTLGLQVGSEALSVSANEHSSDPVISDLHTSGQPSHLLNVNVTLPLEQMSYPIVKDDVQHQDCSMSDNLLEEGAGEETFILTLVEIPISEGYSYSCDGNSVDVLPAPVLITSGSSQVVTPDQSTASLSEPSSSVSCPSGQEEAKLELNRPSRKRSASISSESDKSQPCIKALLCTSAEREDHTTNTTAAFEENETSSRPAEIKTEETEIPHQSSMNIAVSSPEGEKVPECTIDSTRFDTVARIENPASTSYESPSSVLPSSSSSRIQQRPGRKPLGFLSLVCKEKQSQKTKVTSKKNSSKPKSKKAKVQEPEEQDPTRIHENALSNEVPCQSSSSAVTSTPANTETLPCTSQVSENLDTITQDSPKSQELATEEDAATVSEYFFSDIFMEVDE